jgi:hypothetical protein
VATLVGGRTLNMGFMTLAGMTARETLVLGFLVGTSLVKSTTNMSLTVLPESTTSFGILGNPGKVLLGHCS